MDGVVAEMALYGEARFRGRLGAFDLGPYQAELSTLPLAEGKAWIDRVTNAALEAGGGWALFGLTDVILRSDFPQDEPEAIRAITAGLEFQRAGGAWYSQLSALESLFWDRHNDGVEWLPARPVPTRDATSLEPLEVGDERLTIVLTSAPDASRLLVSRPEPDRFVEVTDYPLELGTRAGRARAEGTSAASLFDLYAIMAAQTPVPPHWVSDEFEPFLRYPLPTL